MGVGFAAWLLSLLCDGPVLLRAPLLALVLVALFLYGVIQVVPLPRPLVERASPLAAEAQGTRSEVLAEIGAAEFALIQNFSRADAIYWFHKPRFGGAIFGPFTNRNHFAAHVNMAFGIALGLLLTVTRAPEEQSFATWRKRLAWLISHRGSQIALLGFAALLMAAAALGTVVVRRLALRLGVVDRPDGYRKIDQREMPRLGGVAIYVAFALPLVALWCIPTTGLAPLVGCMNAVNLVVALGWGLAGVATGTTIVWVLYNFFFWTPLVARLLRVRLRRYFLRGTVVPLANCIPAAATFALLRVCGLGRGWLGLLAVLAIAAAVQGAHMLLWGLASKDQEVVLGSLRAAFRWARHWPPGASS